MEIGSFIIDGIHSSELKSYIQHRPEILTPRRKVTFQEVSGRSGAVPFDEKAYENTTMTLTLVTYGDSKEEADYNRGMVLHAFDSGGYLTFTPYFDEDKSYLVHLESMVFSGNRMYNYNQPYTISLTVKPFKFDIQGRKVELTTNPTTLNNPYFYESKPIVTLTGTGDVTLTVNGESIVFKNLQGTLIVDSEMEHCYRMNGEQVINENKKMFSLDFPVLKPGTNQIGWTGNLSKVEIEPRWQTLV